MMWMWWLACGSPEQVDATLLLPAPDCAEGSARVGLGAFRDAWASADGAVIAVGEGTAAIRDAGEWIDDPVPERFDASRVDGQASEIWALGEAGLWFRSVDGWEPVAYPFTLDEPLLRLVDLRVTDRDVWVLLESGAEARVEAWDGSAWRLVAGGLPLGVHTLERLGDGDPLVGSTSGVYVLGDEWAPLATGLDGPVAGVDVAPDGTIAAVSRSWVAVGDRDGLVETELLVEGLIGWHLVLATASDDVWVAGHRAEGVARRAVVMHFDGKRWDIVVDESPDALDGLVWTGTEVVAVGGRSRRLAMAGDERGWSVEVETFGVSALQLLAADDVTGHAHGLGGATVAIDEGAGWTGRPVPAPLGPVRALAASAGRVGYIAAFGRLAVEAPDGSLVITDRAEGEDPTYRQLTGAGGTLFVAGWTRDQAGTERPIVLRDGGAGWAELALGGWPEPAYPFATWAAGPDELWVGMASGDDGVLAHWQSGRWTLHDVPGVPVWGEDTDDAMWISLAGASGGFGTWDPDTGFELVATPLRDVEASHALDDGRLVVAGWRERRASSQLEYAVILRETGLWRDVFAASTGPLPVAGHRDTVWAADGRHAWTLRCAAPAGRR